MRGTPPGMLATPQCTTSWTTHTAWFVRQAADVPDAMSTMVATLLWPQGALAALSLFLFGFGPIVWTITSTTLRQTVTPSAMLGRVSALFLTVNMGARPLGAALGGLIGAHWGEAACLWLALAGFALQLAVIAASPVRRLERLPNAEALA